MSREEDTEPQLPEILPRKLDKVFAQHPDNDQTDDAHASGGHPELKSTHPVKVVEYFLASHADGWADATFKTHSYTLTRFLEYCNYANLDDLSTLSSSDIAAFKEWRDRDGNICLVSLRKNLKKLRVFIRWCEEFELVEDGLADGIELPDVDESADVSYVRLDSETAERILDYYRDRDDVPRMFAKFVLMWVGLCRLGDVRAIDLEDYHSEEGYVEIVHRSDEDTPLKNQESEVEGEGGERRINLPDWVCEVLDTYIEGTGDPNHSKRIDKTDDFGREPLFTSKYGRVSKSTVQRDLYRITQPCRHGQNCPHDHEPESCRFKNDNDAVSRCPSSVSPHPVRRGGICHQLKEGVPKDTICGRADVSRKVLDKHYDLRTKEEAREQRRQELKKHLDGYDHSDSEETETETTTPFRDAAFPSTDDVKPDLQASTQSGRVAKGVAAYCGFVGLTGLNFGLLGIGLDPLTWQVILPV